MSEKLKTIPLGQLLTNSNKITEEQLLKALEEQRKTGDKLGHTLIKLKYITENVLIEVLEKQFGIPAVKINKKMLNPLVAKKIISENICRKYRIIPILIENKKVTIAATNPYDLSFKDEIKFTTDLNIEIVLSPENSVLAAINYIYGDKDQHWDTSYNEADMKGNISAAKILTMILHQGYNMKATDLQLEYSDNVFNVLFITPKKVIRSKPLPNFYFESVSTRIKQLSNLNNNARNFQEGLMTIEIYQKKYTIRVLIFPTNIGENIILKLS